MSFTVPGSQDVTDFLKTRKMQLQLETCNKSRALVRLNEQYRCSPATWVPVSLSRNKHVCAELPCGGITNSRRQATCKQ
jgi:hypothetical protein